MFDIKYKECEFKPRPEDHSATVIDKCKQKDLPHRAQKIWLSCKPTLAVVQTKKINSIKLHPSNPGHKEN